MKYTKNQKVKDLRLLRDLLLKRRDENRLKLDDTKRLFLCFLIEGNIREFDPHFYGWFTDQLYLIDTKYYQFKAGSSVDDYHKTISDLFDAGLAVWSPYNFEDRVKFIDHLIELLS